MDLTIVLLLYVPIALGIVVYVAVMLCRKFRRAPRTVVNPIAIESQTYLEIKPPKDESCAICLQKFALQDSVTVLKCPHLFHVHCLQPWLVIQNKCPMCRVAIESIYDPPINNV